MSAFDFGNFDFDSIGNDDFDLGNIFADESKEKKEEPAADPVEEKAPELSAEEPPSEEKAAEPEKAVEQASEAKTEPEAKGEEPEAKAEYPAKEEPKAGDPKDEPAEEPATDAAAETDAAPVEDVAADAPEAVADDAAAEDESDPVIEVSVKEKAPKAKKAKKVKKAEPKVKAEAPKAEAKEEAKAEVVAPNAEPIDEDILSNFILVLGPAYEAFKKDVQSRLGEIRVQAGMMPAVVKTMIQKNNELDRKLFMEGEGYIDAYTTLADKETGLISCTRAVAESNAKGNAAEKKLVGTLAVMNYTDPLTGKKINLLQYANALKQAVSFVNSAKEHVKSTSIALSTMSKVA